MATITPTEIQSVTPVTLTETTLTGTADGFAYTRGKTKWLIFRNATADTLTPVIDGDGATTVFVQGVGSIDISAGYTMPAIAAGAVAIFDLDNIREYLKGDIAITGGTGLVASILSVATWH